MSESRILLDSYRGWSIYFDVNNERFYCDSDRWDQQEDRGSFKACKKWIDDYIKSNEKFVPIQVEQYRHGGFGEVITIAGVRKDGRFITVDANGVKGQLSDYNLKDYIVVDPRNDEVKSELAEIKAAIKELNKRADDVAGRLIKRTAADIKKEMDMNAPR